MNEIKVKLATLFAPGGREEKSSREGGTGWGEKGMEAKSEGIPLPSLPPVILYPPGPPRGSWKLLG